MLQLLYARCDCCRKQVGRAILGQSVEDVGQLGFEAIFQQSVRLVENYHPCPCESLLHARRAVDVIGQPPWRCYHHVRSLAQLYRLLHHVQTSNDHTIPQLYPGTERYKLILDLKRKLSRWRQDDGKHPVRVLRKLLDDGEGECGCLAASGLGGSKNIPSCQCRRDTIPLHVCWPFQSNSVASSDQPVLNAQRRELSLLCFIHHDALLVPRRVCASLLLSRI
mmetsp:Transcript_49156/g.154316  ORF Transcript_49156/g.154316 Transcript_49156/m.154316 type:complete len:222 (+) Transcript_49156:246-911(+)